MYRKQELNENDDNVIDTTIALAECHNTKRVCFFK